MDWKNRVPETGNVYDLRRPPEAERKYNPDFDAAVGVKAKSIEEVILNHSKSLSDQSNWEMNPAYTKWLEKKESYELASDLRSSRWRMEAGLEPPPPDLQTLLSDLRTYSLADRLKNLNTIMGPKNGR